MQVVPRVGLDVRVETQGPGPEQEMVHEHEHGPELVLVEVPFADERVQRLVDEVQAHYVAIYGGPDESPVDPLQFSAPRGLFVLGLAGDAPVAMGGWRWRPELDDRFDGDRVAEVKRMYVSTTVRGRGFARRLLAHLESTGAAAGVQRLVLETGTMQPDAIALYESSGYEPVEPFGHYASSPYVKCFGKHLGSVGDLSRSG
ncbi:GNAT family N-acetyltransferase [Knoellia locipacati]|uniref:N-acetyltransferase n=1 Tax=Knoellia locipacati TaxID=882824 RepID=A0A512T0P1_9MICO|nr:N-acetyltransferase [Knoellia locipacati]